MAAHTSTLLTTPAKTPSEKSSSISRKHLLRDQINQGAESVDWRGLRSRFEAYNRLQAAAVAFGEKLPIPEIVALGGQSDGKSSLLEALLGFRFNVREVEMGTRRPLILQMVHDPTALEPRCRFQEEYSEEYGSSLVLASAIADIIKSRTEALLKKSQTSVSSRPIVMRAEYAHSPNLTIIDTPGFVLKAKKGEPENTPEEILSMVKSLASPPHRILLFLQQSSVEWCSSLWLDAIREIDPTFRRTVIVVSKFDNRLKEFSDRWEVDRYLSASGYLGDNIRTFFVALPKDRNNVSNDEFRRQIFDVDSEVLRHLREDITGGFNEEKFSSCIGFGCLKEYLESELQKRYEKAAPVTLALLEQRCSEVAIDLVTIESKILATSDIGHLRRFAMSYAASVCHHVGALIDGAVDPSPEQWGKTTFEEQSRSSIGNWPGVSADVKPPNATLRLYGGAAFERVMREFWCAAHFLECPSVSREKVANILLANAGRGRSKAITEAAAEIGRTAARSWLSPLLDTACDRLAFVLENLFDLALERNRIHDLEYGRKPGNMDGYVGFHAALRHVYNRFIKDLAKQCKQLARKHLDYVTSPFSLVCYENESGGSFLNSTSHHKFSQNSVGSFSYELSDGGAISRGEIKDQENIPLERSFQLNKLGKDIESKEVFKESEMTIPETPSPDQPCDGVAKKDLGKGVEMGAKKCVSRITRNNRNCDRTKGQDGVGGSFGDADGNSRTYSTYSEICLSAAQHFSRIREVLVDQSVASTLNAGFLTPWRAWSNPSSREKLVLALGLELFAVNDEKFMDMFAAPGAIDGLQNERQSLQKRQKTLQTSLNEFKSVARSL